MRACENGAASTLYIELSGYFLEPLAFETVRFPEALLVAKPLLRTQRRYAEAGKLSESAQTILEKAFGPEHPAVAESLHSRAALKLAQVRHWFDSRYTSLSLCDAREGTRCNGTAIVTIVYRSYWFMRDSVSTAPLIFRVRGLKS